MFKFLGYTFLAITAFLTYSYFTSGHGSMTAEQIAEEKRVFAMADKQCSLYRKIDTTFNYGTCLDTQIQWIETFGTPKKMY